MKRSLETLSQLEEESATKAPRTTYVYAFKVLAPDSLAAAILGARGAGIQEMQSITQSKISLADRSDKYHNTNQRLVLIRGDNHQAIYGAMQGILSKLRSLIENPKVEDAKADINELTTKAGEYRLKCVVPKQSAGALIGHKGANISELRETTGCKVRVEEGKVGSGETAEQVISLMGSIDALMACLQQINYLVQDQAGQPFFQEWAHLRVKPLGSADPARQSLAQQFAGNATTVTPRIGLSRAQPGVPVPLSVNDDSMVHRALTAVPKTLVNNRTFAVQASLPVEAMSGLIGKGGNNTKEITAQTGAKVTLRDHDPNTVVTIEGSLNSVLSGYTLLMKLYLELEASGGLTSGKGRVKA